MGEVGILGESDELIDGVVYFKGLGKPWHWTVDDYDAMYEAGIIDRNERVELIDGEIITLGPIGPEHMESVARLNRVLLRLEGAFGPEYCVIPEAPIGATSDFKPQPDIMVAKGDLGDFGERGLAVSDIRLVVEVSKSTLRTDRKRKFLLYGQLGIPEYWIVNLQSRQLEVYRDPSGGGYGTQSTLNPDESVTPLFAPNIRIAVSEILPRGPR